MTCMYVYEYIARMYIHGEKLRQICIMYTCVCMYTCVSIERQQRVWRQFSA